MNVIYLTIFSKYLNFAVSSKDSLHIILPYILVTRREYASHPMFLSRPTSFEC